MTEAFISDAKITAKRDKISDRPGEKKPYKTSGGFWAEKYKGEIEYFDSEEQAKAYIQHGHAADNEPGGTGGEAPDKPEPKQTSMSATGGFGDDDDMDDEKNASEKENEKIEKELQDIAKDKGLTVGSEDANHGGEIHSLVGKDDDPDNTLGFHAAPNFDDDGNMTNEPQYAIELGMGSSPMYFDSKEEADSALQKIVDDERIRKAMDGEGGETLFDLGDHAKSILKGKDETINVNLKEKYDRIFRSLK